MGLDLSDSVLDNMQLISHHFLAFFVEDDDPDHPLYDPSAHLSDEESIDSV